jgi:hypothetical protein
MRIKELEEVSKSVTPNIDCYVSGRSVNNMGLLLYCYIKSGMLSYRFVKDMKRLSAYGNDIHELSHHEEKKVSSTKKI